MRSAAIWLLFCLLPLIACNEQKGKEPERSISQKDATPAESHEAGEITTGRDTAEIDRLITLGADFVDSYTDSAIFYFLEVARSSQQIGYPEGEASAYNNLSFCYAKKKSDSAKIYSRRFEEVLPLIPSPSYNHLRHKELLAYKYKSLAARQYEATNYDLASAFYLKAITILGKPSKANYSILTISYAGLGAIAGRLSNPERAAGYFRQAGQLAVAFNDIPLLILVKANIATLWMDKEEYAKAKKTALEALTLEEKTGDTLSYRSNLANTMAICLIQEGKPGEAMLYSNMVMQAAEHFQTAEKKIAAHYILGYNYVQLGQYEVAIKHLLKGLAIAEPRHIIDNITNSYGQLAVAYEKLGEYEHALFYQKKYVSLRDSLLGHENAARIAEIDTRYRVAQKDKLLTQKDKALLLNELKMSSQQKEMYLWIGASVVSILLLLILLIHRRSKINITRLKATLAGEERERRRMAQELHDGIVSRLSIIKMNFSALSLQYQSRQDASDLMDVVDQLEQSILELRTTSHNLLPKVLQQAGLSESVRIYCEKTQSISSLNIEFQLLGALPPLTDDFQLNVYRIIQELINNILKHSNATHALIQFQVRGQYLSITIDDNGSIHHPADGQANHPGIGMQNLQDRVHFLHGSMEIERGKGTSVYLEFDLKKFIRKR